jgi:hypothetical protein
MGNDRGGREGSGDAGERKGERGKREEVGEGEGVKEGKV